MEEVGKWRTETRPQFSTPEEKLKYLCSEIEKAERKEDEAKARILEAELRAVEKGEEFDEQAYLLNAHNPPSLTKKQVLNQLQSLQKSRGTDSWKWDGPQAENPSHWSYNAYFAKLLTELGYSSIEDVVKKKAEALGRPISAIDLFGGAYFLNDLSNISRIVGVRLENLDEVYAEHYTTVDSLQEDHRREVIEGDLYSGRTWKKIAEELKENDMQGFDLMICRPQGPFGHTIYPVASTKDIKESGTMYAQEIHVALLERAMKVMSKEDGLFFLQKPILSTSANVERDFWDKFIKEKKEEGYDFSFEENDPRLSDYLVIKRHEVLPSTTQERTSFDIEAPGEVGGLGDADAG